MRTSIACIVALSLVAGAFATTGIDFSTYVGVDGLQCVASQGHGGFAIPRVYQSIGRVDPNAVANIQNAWAAGYPHVDGYIFPCPTCGNGGGQVNAAINALRAGGANFGMLWFDIEGSQYWMDQGSNQAFFNDMYNAAMAAGINFGVYTSASQWSSIMGSWTGGGDRPLWYAHYDGSPSFSDFSPFGGWSSAAMKQYDRSDAKTPLLKSTSGI